MPNIIFYLITLDKMKKVKNILDKSDKKNIREELNSKTKYYGYNELDCIYINDINLEININNFEYYKIIKSFKIKDKMIEELQLNEGLIKPYSINFIEVKSSLNYLKKKSNYKFFK